MSQAGAARRLIRLLRLKPHPEGGFYRETYRAAGRFPGKSFPGGRNYSTAILFLLPRGEVSRLHRIKSDEVFHLYAGGPLFVEELDCATGRAQRVRLDSGKVQHVVKAGTWFGASLAPSADFALAGCTVAPGFDFKDFELGGKAVLLRKYPVAHKLIERLAHD